MKRKPPPNIEDVAEPKIGRYYMVPCVWDDTNKIRRNRQLNGKTGGWWPIIGTWHEDHDIGFPGYHYHFDVRFFPQYEFDMRDFDVFGCYGGYSLARVFSPSFFFAKARYSPGGENDRDTHPIVTKLRMMMKREMPDFPMRDKHAGVGEKSKIQTTLETMFQNTKLKCKTCPHRGFSLEGLPMQPDGTVICNGHGLKWNLKTGEMVMR